MYALIIIITWTERRLDLCLRSGYNDVSTEDVMIFNLFS